MSNLKKGCDVLVTRKCYQSKYVSTISTIICNRNRHRLTDSLQKNFFLSLEPTHTISLKIHNNKPEPFSRWNIQFFEIKFTLDNLAQAFYNIHAQHIVCVRVCVCHITLSTQYQPTTKPYANCMREFCENRSRPYNSTFIPHPRSVVYISPH